MNLNFIIFSYEKKTFFLRKFIVTFKKALFSYVTVSFRNFFSIIEIYPKIFIYVTMIDEIFSFQKLKINSLILPYKIILRSY